MDGVKIEIPAVPPSMNHFAGRQNAWEYREVKADWTRTVCLLCGRQKPTKPFDRAVVTITYRFADRRRRDPDNYCGKVIMDGLTAAGIIVDDSFDHVELRLRAEHPGKPRTTVEVIPID